MKSRQWHTQPIGNLSISNGFGTIGEQYFEYLAINQYSPRTIVSKRDMLRMFVRWCLTQQISKPECVSPLTIERFQKHLFYHRQINALPLSLATQRTRLTTVKIFFNWLIDRNIIESNPTQKLSLPRITQALPKYVLSESEVEQVIAAININTKTGLRDKAMIEVMYSSAIRRSELANLSVYDADTEAGILRIRHGKGNKDRIIPVGERAVYWIEKYKRSAREKLLKGQSCSNLFLSIYGKPLSLSTITSTFSRYIKSTGITKEGSCHIFRHSTATLMLENGADIRVIQSLLGHASLATTQIYTRVSIKHLQDVHKRTHPAKYNPLFK